MKRKGVHPFAAIFSFVLVGMGQVLKGDSKKGVKWMLWFYMGIPFAVYLSFFANPYLFIFLLAISVVIMPLFWAYNILDAFFY